MPQPQQIDKRHRIAGLLYAIHARAKGYRITESMLLLVAGRTGYGIVYRQRFLVKQHSAQFKAFDCLWIVLRDTVMVPKVGRESQLQ